MTRIHLRLFVLAAIVAVGAVIASARATADAGDGTDWSPVIYPLQRLPLVFSHKAHLGRGATCTTCHTTALTSRSALDNLLPTEAACRACHPIDRAQPAKIATPVAACAGCHAGWQAGQPIARTYLTPSPLKFDHSAHQMSACESCHRGIREVELATTKQLPTMQSCLACHKQGGEERRCADCHVTQLGGRLATTFEHGELAPRHAGLGDDHGPGFEREHAVQARAPGATCAACHDRSECVDCHQGVVKPAGFHDGNYLLIHAGEARRGRPDCSACHRYESFCVACHEREGLGTRAVPGFGQPTRPFHVAGWASTGGGPNLHAGEARRNVAACASCHRDEDCMTCHSAEASSARVTPHPAGWRGSARCRALDRANRRMCLRCHIAQDELGCDWTKSVVVPRLGR